MAIRVGTKASGLTKEETRRTLRQFNRTLVLRSIGDAIAGSGTLVFTSYALALGISSESMGYIASCLSVALLVQVLGLPLVNRVRNKKRFVLLVGTLEPLLFIVAVLLAPILPIAWRLPLFMGSIFLAAGILNLARPLVDEWLATTIPPHLRGSFTGRRMQLLAATTALVGLVMGVVLDLVGRSNVVGLALLLAGGGAWGVLAIRQLIPATMPNLSAAATVTWIDAKRMLRNRSFVRLIIAYILFDLPFIFACPYYQVYNLESVKMSASSIAAMMAAYQVIKLPLLGPVGRLVDRHGPRRVLVVTAPAYICFFGLMAIATPDRSWVMYPAWILAGVGDSVFSVTMITSLYATLPNNPSRSAYFAGYNVMTLGMFAVGGVLAVPILTALKGHSLIVGGITYGSYNLFYGLVTLAMIPCLTAAFLLPDGTAAKPAPDLSLTPAADTPVVSRDRAA